MIKCFQFLTFKWHFAGRQQANMLGGGGMCPFWSWGWLEGQDEEARGD